MSGPLAGYRVLSLEHYLAGNHGTWLMSMFGAEVIKVERPGHGDTLRGVGPFVESPAGRRSAGELRVMGNKSSIALDITTQAGRDVLFELVAKSDVVWANQKPSSLERLGIDFDSLRRHNPDIVYATLSGFGHGDVVDAGPLTNLRAFDIIAQGLAGLQFRAGSSDGGPGYNGLALGDEVTSTLTVLGVALALLRRERTGGGAQRVDVAMHDSMVFLNELALGMLSVLGRTPPRGRSGTSAPYGAFPTADGWVNIAIGGDPVWRRFCTAIGQPDLISDARFATSAGRVSHFDLVESVVKEWTTARTTDQVVATLSPCEVPCGAVLDIPGVLASDQVAARQMLSTIDDPIAGKVQVVGNPIKMNDLTDGHIAAPHAAGADTETILRDLLGKTAADVDALVQAGAVALPTDRTGEADAGAEQGPAS
ncbi:CaiB/BaiF CoA-transferase family protein [Dactylosporangium salmoneum]|uniref:CaiB/BaiF CoA-transferase family protein n=1 Tax=Dactylosporangium salmoneum TaxID=53361 RepID=A0ABN3H891_9ACTN